MQKPSFVLFLANYESEAYIRWYQKVNAMDRACFNMNKKYIMRYYHHTKSTESIALSKRDCE